MKDHPDAVKVIGVWEDGKTHTGELGYLPAETAADLAPFQADAVGATVSMMIRPRRGHAAGLRLTLWQAK